jgi:hypothetical protein
MGMLKIVWTYLMDAGDGLIPLKRYAFLIGVVGGFLIGYPL